jgi:cytidyltransferase-like protein
MNLPLLTVCRNVYCDGVYDLCHIGHKNLFKRALTNGNRLFVGVCNDEDCSGYKRPPIMTHDERCAEVEACKAVTKVIPNAPCFGITQEFVDKHQIHVVAMGQEYFDKYPNPDDDPYYGYVRKIGIAKGMPRTPGLSTSDLIKRIQKAAPADQRNDKKGK